MKKLTFVGCFLASLIVGVLVFLLSFLAVWSRSPTTLMNNEGLISWSQGAMRKIVGLIDERIEKGESPPALLRELSPVLRWETFPNSRVKIVRNQVPVDGWGRPFLYSVHGTSYSLTTYGRDGKPGGSYFDRDLNLSNYRESLYYSDLLRSESYANPPMPTLHEFLFELPPAKGMILACVLSGVIAFLAALYLIRPTRISKLKVVDICIRIFVTILASVFFATLMMQLHIPSGH